MTKLYNTNKKANKNKKKINKKTFHEFNTMLESRQKICYKIPPIKNVKYGQNHLLRFTFFCNSKTLLVRLSHNKSFVILKRFPRNQGLNLKCISVNAGTISTSTSELWALRVNCAVALCLTDFLDNIRVIVSTILHYMVLQMKHAFIVLKWRRKQLKLLNFGRQAVIIIIVTKYCTIRQISHAKVILVDS